MKLNKKLVTLIGAPVAVLLFVILLFSCTRKKDASQSLETTPVIKGSIRTVVQATATVTPEHKLEIIPSIAGRAETVEVEMGAKVKAGQVLLWMSSTERAAMLDAARAKGEKELTFWKDVYKPTPVTAPLDGTIISRNVVPGQAVQTSTNVFVMSDRLIVEADLDETDLGKVALDQSVEVTLDGLPDLHLHGKVYKIAYSSTTVNNVTTYKVDVLLDEIPEAMRSGMTANVTFIISERTGVLLIPASAIQGGKSVFVRDAKSGEIAAHEIKIGLNDGKMAEVISGLNEGDLVASSSYKVIEASSNTGFSLMPKMPKRKGNAPPP